MRLSRASKYGENSIELASGDLSTRFVIKAETEPIADMFVRTFQKAKNSISQAAFKKLNHLLNQKAAFEYFDKNLKDLTTPGKYLYEKKYLCKCVLQPYQHFKSEDSK